MVRQFAVLVLAFALPACASQIMKNYVGKPLTDPILDYGPPAAAFDTGDGNRAFVWTMKTQGVVPGSATTTGSAWYGTTGSVTPIGNQVTFNSQTTANLYANTIITPPTAYSYDCHYALFARKTRADVDGPAGWQVVGFKPPKLMCE